MMTRNAARHEADAVPEPTRTCLHCACGFFDDSRFLINLMACGPTLMTCFNYVDHPGRLWQVGPDRTCRTSRYKSVCYDPGTGKWRASINHRLRHRHCDLHARENASQSLNPRVEDSVL